MGVSCGMNNKCATNTHPSSTPYNQETISYNEAEQCLNKCLEALCKCVVVHDAEAILRKAMDLLEESETLRAHYLNNALAQGWINRPYQAVLINQCLKNTLLMTEENPQVLHNLMRTVLELQNRLNERTMLIKSLEASQKIDDEICSHVERLLAVHDQTAAPSQAS